MSKISLSVAKDIIHCAEIEALRIGIPMVISAVDEGGNLIAVHKMDDALLASIDISINKAWTSAALKMPTAALARLAASGAPLYGINTTNNGRIVLFGGGIPLIRNHRVIGGLGVSGGSVEQDIYVAEAAVAAFHFDGVHAGLYYGNEGVF